MLDDPAHDAKRGVEQGFHGPASRLLLSFLFQSLLTRHLQFPFSLLLGESPASFFKSAFAFSLLFSKSPALLLKSALTRQFKLALSVLLQPLLFLQGETFSFFFEGEAFPFLFNG